jgi:monosaccharide-transporting ATPase
MGETATHLPALSLNLFSKQFAGVIALNEVSFELQAGEVHALLGENGAGKSTLIKVMTGAYSLDSGSITLFGASFVPHSPAQALAAGISTVYQEVNLLPNLSVAHNLYLGREPTRFGLINWSQMHDDAKTLLARFRLDIDVSQPLSLYSLAVQQLVAIARGIDLSARVLVLDEPTASLDHDEVQMLFSILRELKAQGIAIIFITHFLDQVYALADRITVLRNGERVGTFVAKQLPRAELVAHMLGRELEALEQKLSVQIGTDAGNNAIAIKDLSATNGITTISFRANRGEVLGLSGLLGSGRTELCETLFGLARSTGGSIKLNGNCISIGSPRQAVRYALALCPEDRKTAGIISELSIRENIILALQARRGWLQPLARAEQQDLADNAVSELSIACPHTEKAVGELSGGNQQKVILARWLATSPAILILDEPTRGIDIGAHAEIIHLIRRLCEKGLTVIVASSEIEELVAVCDKVIVLRDLGMQAELAGSDISEQRIMAAMARSDRQEAQS